MPTQSQPRVTALAAAALLLSATLSACGSSDAKDEDLPTQKLSWKACPAPDAAQGGGAPPRRCPAARPGSAPP